MKLYLLDILYCIYCTVLIVLHLLCCTYCAALIVLHLMCCTYCAALIVLYLLFCTFCTYCIILYLLYLFLFSTSHYTKCCTIQYLWISQGKTRCQVCLFWAKFWKAITQTVCPSELKIFEEMYFGELYQRSTREVLKIDQSIAIDALSMPVLDDNAI
jgi:hypothetical protein